MIRHGGDNPKLWFNYRSEETRVWDDETLRNAYGYQTHYPQDEKAGLVFVLGGEQLGSEQ